MTLLSIILGALILLAAGVKPFVVGVACAFVLVAYGAGACWAIWCDYQLRGERNREDFVESYAAALKHQREARETCDCG